MWFGTDMNIVCDRGEGGFSLLEVLVALAIMALSLGAIYQVAGGSTRGVQMAEVRTQAVTLALSLLDSRTVVPAGGFSEQGVSGDLLWQMQAIPYPTGHEAAPGWPLYQVEVIVSWGAGGDSRQMRLATLLPERNAAVANIR